MRFFLVRKRRSLKQQRPRRQPVGGGATRRPSEAIARLVAWTAHPFRSDHFL
jgi:hypothetical protein